MTILAAAMATLFADEAVTESATWGGTSCRVAVSRPDETVDFRDTRLSRPTVMLTVLVSVIAAPAAGDVVVIGADSYVVQGSPQRDISQLTWHAEARAQ